MAAGSLPHMPLPIASFKLQFAQRRCRAVPALDPSGCVFAGPGVDLTGALADELLGLATPLLRWLEAREPVRVRSLSFDVRRRRLLVTLEETPRPRVVKIDPGIDAGASAELLALAQPLIERLGQVVLVKLSERGKH